MKPPKVSILVPIYGVEKFIERCSRSLFEQTFEDIEYIFVNDCTPDKSISILESTIKDYPVRKDQIKIVHHSVNQGIAAVRNTCLENANGEYTLFVDSDDWVEKNMVELMYNKAISENADIVGCDYYKEYIDHQEYIKEIQPSSKLELINAVISQLFFVVMWKLLIKKEVYKKNKIYFNTELRVGEDSIVCLKAIYYSEKIVYLKEALYHYTLYNNNHLAHRTLRNIQLWTKAILMIEEFCIEKDLYRDNENELNLRKFIIKQSLILEPALRNLKLWHDLLPESNHIWAQIPMRLDDKIIYFLVEKQLNIFASILLSLKSILKKAYNYVLLKK